MFEDAPAEWSIDRNGELPDPPTSFTITISSDGKEFYANANLDSLNFVCETRRPTIEAAIESVMGEVREYAETIQRNALALTEAAWEARTEVRNR